MNIKISRGFSLLEIIIAMLILSLVVTGMVGLFVTSHKFVIEAGHRLAAINYAKRVAETLKVYVSADPNTPTGAGTDDDHALDGDGATGEIHNPSLIGLPNTITTSDGIPLTCTYNVVEDINADGTSTDLEQVRIRVSWTEP